MSTCIYEVKGKFLSTLGVLKLNARLRDARLVPQEEVARLTLDQLSPLNDKDRREMEMEWSLAQRNHLFPDNP